MIYWWQAAKRSTSIGSLTRPQTRQEQTKLEVVLFFGKRDNIRLFATRVSTGRHCRKEKQPYVDGCLVVVDNEVGINFNIGRRQGGLCDELEFVVADQFPGKPEERLLEVVVGPRRDLKVLDVLLAVESDGAGFDFALL
jgi:hypothetical protein